MRSFNTSGPNIPERHYTLERRALVAKGINLVHNERYFTIWAPRQTGKSTFFRLMADTLEAEGYHVIHFNVENYNGALLSGLLDKLSSEVQKIGANPPIFNTFDDFSRFMESVTDRRVVLIIDEIEGLNPALFGQFLHSIRNLYHFREGHCLKSAILVGVSNIVGVVQDNASPFNIADNLNVPYFTNEETAELLAQHERETGQLFAPEVKAKISEVTGNQPGLVNGFAAKLVEDHPTAPLIGYEDYLRVEQWYLTQNIDKNVSNIINKAKKHREFVQRLLFNESEIPFQIYKDHIKELYVNGVITYDESNNVVFNVPLYKKCLHAAFYPDMNGEPKEIQKNISTKAYLTAEGRLDLDKIILDYKAYAQRRGFRAYMEKDGKGKFVSIKESALVYSFETFVNAFLGVIGGKSYLEAHAGLGRMDMVVTVNGHEQVVESKVYRNITQFGQGKRQLAYYCQKIGLAEGFYLVFVESDVTHEEVLEAQEIVEGVLIKTSIVRYDLEKDFTDPAKRKKKGGA